MNTSVPPELTSPQRVHGLFEGRIEAITSGGSLSAFCSSPKLNAGYGPPCEGNE